MREEEVGEVEIGDVLSDIVLLKHDGKKIYEILLTPEQLEVIVKEWFRKKYRVKHVDTAIVTGDCLFRMTTLAESKLPISEEHKYPYSGFVIYEEDRVYYVVKCTDQQHWRFRWSPVGCWEAVETMTNDEVIDAWAKRMPRKQAWDYIKAHNKWWHANNDERADAVDDLG